MTEHGQDDLPRDEGEQDAVDGLAVESASKEPSTPEEAKRGNGTLQTDPGAFGGDFLSYVADHSIDSEPHRPALPLPEDLRISWSWVHLLFFLFVAAASLIVLPMVLAIGIQVYRHQTQPDFQQLASNAGFLIATQMLWFGTVFFFLYLTLSVLRDAPFWSTMGWTRLGEYAAGKRYRPWMFASSGGGLAIFVAVGSSRVKGADDTPIEQLFKNPHAAFLLMAMAVFVAPLVEETVFRGYLYPLFASKLSQAAVYFGADARQALRIGTASGVLLTGFLFGMMHGSQLGWNLMLVGLLTTVGVIFTLARAITGTVLASFLMHLGYNSLIALTSIISTKGFQVVPPGH